MRMFSCRWMQISYKLWMLQVFWNCWWQQKQRPLYQCASVSLNFNSWFVNPSIVIQCFSRPFLRNLLQFIRPIQKSPCFRSRSPWKLDSVGRIIFFILDYFFILCRPLIQMNTQDMHAPKHHCMQHIAKSQTWHCYIARCMWSKLHTEKNYCFWRRSTTETSFQDPNCFLKWMSDWLGKSGGKLA